ncbi:cell division protein FtsQ/DivIB [Gordonia hydrophobica]|uniref:FtsQ-type POTRA domain-containing protein n=1 Tax=Gordonia hydrophobica TaxID=40516 RepID=A0ABZ2U0U4_9ACTN|nr:FtsQ-type POTRA domain-containing protein [Gordonia hydrophobica]MBM7367116.1 cell division protein FtsQ [Gordonia hydrophobica]
MTRRAAPSPAEPTRRRRKTILVAVALAVVAAGLTAVAFFTPLMSVRSVEVTGTRTLDSAEVLRLAEVPMGRPLLRVDTAGIAQRVSVLPTVESVNVEVGYPSTVTIDVTERTPLVTVPRGDKIGVMDRLGMVYLTYDDAKAMPKSLRGLPGLTMDEPGASNPTTKAALTVVQGLPDWLRSQVRSVTADSPSGITLALTKNRTVVWGDAGRTADKAEALQHLMTVDGTEYNVSSPEFASVR